MKKIIKISSFVLIVSGIILSFSLLREQNLLIWLHILLGFAYSVIFLLFSFDHIKTNRKKLDSINRNAIAGILQIIFGIVVLISGFIIYLHGISVISPWTEIHFWSTICFLCSSAIHFFFNSK